MECDQGQGTAKKTMSHCCLRGTKTETGDQVLYDIMNESISNGNGCQGRTSTGAREEVHKDTHFSNFDSNSNHLALKRSRDFKVNEFQSYNSDSDNSLNRGIVKEDNISVSLRVKRQRQLLASSLTNHAQSAGAEIKTETSKSKVTSSGSQCRILTPSSLDPHIPDNCIRFVCLSDTHSMVEDSNYIQCVPYGDVLLHAGDFTDAGEICQLMAFNEFLGKLPHPVKIAVPGNHDVTLDPRGIICNLSRLRKSLKLEKLLDSGERLSPQNYEEVRQKLLSLVPNATILIDAWTTVCGVKIYGYPWLPKHGLPGFGLTNKEDFINKQGFIPHDTDILLTHGPPRGYCDTTRKGEPVGCPILKSTVTQRVHPDVVVCGHIHEARGVTTDGSTMFINAAVCDRRYYPVNVPYVFDYTLPPGFTRDDLLQHTQQSLPVCWDRQTS